MYGLYFPCLLSHFSPSQNESLKTLFCLAKLETLAIEDIGNYTFTWLKDGVPLLDQTHANRSKDFVEDIWLPLNTKVLTNGLMLKIGDIQVSRSSDSQLSRVIFLKIILRRCLTRKIQSEQSISF